MYVSEADPGVNQDFVEAKKQQAYVVCIEGILSIRELVHLDSRDAIEVRIWNDFRTQEINCLMDTMLN